MIEHQSCLRTVLGKDKTVEFLLEDLCLEVGEGSSEKKPFPVFAVFQVCTAENNQYAKVTYVVVSCSATLPYSLILFCVVISNGRRGFCTDSVWHTEFSVPCM